MEKKLLPRNSFFCFVKKEITEKSSAKRKKILIIALCFFVIFFLSAQDVVNTVPSQEFAPDTLRRPEYVTYPLLPRDISIGELGRGTASIDSYNYTRKILADLRQKKISTLPADFPVQTRNVLESALQRVAPRKLRIGGGREEIDGSSSFLFRFIGREYEFVGEIYLRQNGDEWMVEDIIAETPRSLEDVKKDDNTYLWLPYDRIY
jgi:hypothetical protein